MEFIYLVLLVIWINAVICKFADKKILDLDQRLDEFKDCYITLHVNMSEVDLVPLSIPHEFLPLKEPGRVKGKGPIYVGNETPRKHGQRHKCTLLLYILPYSTRYLPRLGSRECSRDPCFIVIIFSHSNLLTPTFSQELWRWIFGDFISRYMIFYWTIEATTNETRIFDQPYRFHSTVHICPYCLTSNVQQPYEEISGNSRAEMEQTAIRARGLIRWNAPGLMQMGECPNEFSVVIGKLPLKHIVDTKIYRQSFYPFIKNLAQPTNLTILAENFRGNPTAAPIFCFGRSPLTNTLNHNFNFISGDNEGFNFITCHTGEDTFWKAGAVFVWPFRKFVWTGLGACVAACLLFFGILLVVRPGENRKSSIWLMITAMAYSFIEMDVSHRTEKILMNDSILRSIFMSWLLMNITITNAYKGMLFLFLRLPWKAELDKNYFAEHDNFTYYGSISNQRTDDIMCDPDCLVKGLGLIDPVLCSGRGYEGRSEFEKNLYLTTGHLMRLKSNSNETLNLMNFYKTMVKSNAPAFPSCKTNELLQRLSDEPKSAYVTWTREINQRMLYFKQRKPELTFFKGKENFLSQPQHWTFTKIPYTKPYFRMVQLMSSGIYKYWQYWLQEAEYHKAKKRREVQISALSSKSNVFFVFYILLFGIALACCAFVSELAANLAMWCSKRIRLNRPKWVKRARVISNSVIVLAGVIDETPLEK